MKTRKLFTIRAAGRTVGRRLRCIAHARRALRACKRLGINATMAPIAVNAQEFDSYGRRIPAPAPRVDVFTGMPVAA